MIVVSIVSASVAHVAEIELLEIGMADVGGVELVDHRTMLHDADPCAGFLGAEEIVRGHENCDPVVAQVVQHGTDHRSQVCTALSSFGLTPPEVDLWAFGEATGRTRPEYL